MTKENLNGKRWMLLPPRRAKSEEGGDPMGVPDPVMPMFTITFPVAPSLFSLR